MAFIPVPDTAECALRMAYFGQLVVNTLYFTKTGGFVGTDLLDLATVLDAWWETNIAPSLSQDIGLVSIQARDISEASGPVSEFFLPEPYVGRVVGPGLPGNVAWSLQFKTGLAGRSFRGRNFICGLPESGAVGNSIVLAVAGALLAGYVALNAAVAVELAALHVVVSRFSLHEPRTVGIATAVETYGYADLSLDSMRRRLNGRGQ